MLNAGFIFIFCCLLSKVRAASTASSTSRQQQEESADDSDTGGASDADFVFLRGAGVRSTLLGVGAASPVSADVLLADAVTVDELEATLAAAAEFQTVTKKQRRKKRNGSVRSKKNSSVPFVFFNKIFSLDNSVT